MSRLKKVPRWKSAVLRLHRAKKLSVREISRISGIPRRTLRNIISGRSKVPKAKTKAKLTRAATKVFDYEPIRYEVSCNVRLDDTVDPTGWTNHSRWEQLFRSMKQPDISKYHHASWTVIYDIYDSHGKIVAKDCRSRFFADRGTFGLDLWKDSIFVLLANIRANYGIRISASEGYAIIHDVAITLYPKG